MYNDFVPTTSILDARKFLFFFLVQNDISMDSNTQIIENINEKISNQSSVNLSNELYPVITPVNEKAFYFQNSELFNMDSILSRMGITDDRNIIDEVVQLVDKTLRFKKCKQNFKYLSMFYNLNIIYGNEKILRKDNWKTLKLSGPGKKKYIVSHAYIDDQNVLHIDDIIDADNVTKYFKLEIKPYKEQMIKRIRGMNQLKMKYVTENENGKFSTLKKIFEEDVDKFRRIVRIVEDFPHDDGETKEEAMEVETPDDGETKEEATAVETPDLNSMLLRVIEISIDGRNVPLYLRKDELLDYITLEVVGKIITESALDKSGQTLIEWCSDYPQNLSIFRKYKGKSYFQHE